MLRNDYKVEKRRTEADISAFASRLWTLFDARAQAEFPIKRAIEKCQTQAISENGLLKIAFFDQTKSSPPARVVFNPLTLIVDRECWELLKWNCPTSRWILAHEFGHILLHNSNSMAFSNDSSLRIKFSDPEYSSEWQADMFAYHLLMPDWVVHSLKNTDLIAKMCAVEEEIARRRLEIFERRWKGRYQA